MPGQNIPPRASQPNYGDLKQATLGPSTADGVDQALDAAIPDDPLNSTLQPFKKQVRQFMSQRDEHGLIMKPDTWQAMVGARAALETNPQLANAELVKSITRTAIHDGELKKDDAGHLFAIAGSDDGFAMGRQGAVQTLGKIMDLRPDLADATLVKNITTIAACDPDSDVREKAQNTLAKIANSRADLINADMVKVVSDIAASRGIGHLEKPEYNEKLVGWQDDRADNAARNTAQQTLRTISEKRPDLVSGAKGGVALKENLGPASSDANLVPGRSPQFRPAPQ